MRRVLVEIDPINREKRNFDGHFEKLLKSFDRKYMKKRDKRLCQRNLPRKLLVKEKHCRFEL